MLTDARHVADGETIRAQVCVVGAGPAGLALAAEFCDRGFDVCLLESGGFEYEEATQSLAHTEVDEREDLYPNAYWCYSRMLGGTANQWCIYIDGQIHVRYKPLDPIDFTKRDWVPFSGWPISRQDLDPYYARAHAVCQAGPYRYAPEDWCDGRTEPLRFESGRVVTNMFQFGPRDAYTKTLKERIERAQNVRCMLHANVVELETDPDGRTVTAARVACLAGPVFRVEAKYFALAQGAYEVPKLLLMSNGVHQNGLGNQHDLVGRFLNDHQIVRAGVLKSQDPGLVERLALYDLRKSHGHPVIGKLSLAPEVTREEGLLNIANAFIPRHQSFLARCLQSIYFRGTTSRSTGYRSARKILDAIRQRRLPVNMGHHLLEIIKGLDDILYVKTRSEPWLKPRYGVDQGGWSEVPAEKRGFSEFEIVQLAEQAPDPENRITLCPGRDRLGLPMAKIFWRWNDIDIRSICRTQDILKAELASAGLGELEIERRDAIPLQVQTSAHHPAGTARMADDPKQGVVDAECRVHGIDNLYVASSAVFPASGYSNPTLTIVAVALRVADRLRKALEEEERTTVAA